jgi:L-lactate dehydrogenase complex protein LldF
LKPVTEHYREIAREQMKDEYAKFLLPFFYPVSKGKRDGGFATLPDPSAFMERGKKIRANVLAGLPDLLELFEKNATANGAKVFWARDAAEANEYILNLARRNGVQYVTKGKSLVSDEMGLNSYLEENGIKSWETDLGEFIAQLLDRPPFHMVGPALNIKVEVIRDTFMKEIGMKEPTLKPDELGRAAREFLRDKFHHLVMGITGVNFAVAETGTIINIENEGNIRFNKSVPKIQVSIMSLEKVVPTMNDAMALLRLLPRSCTGQKITSYLTMDNGPKGSDEIDGPEELHIVIIDNGRSKIYADIQTREVLRCIRCGACQMVCPIYNKIGGYPYGWIYVGPIGQILNSLLLGLNKTRDLYESSTLCKACKIVCPAGVDHPEIFLYLRAKNFEKSKVLKAKGVSLLESLPLRGYTLAASNRLFWFFMNLGMRLFMNRTAVKGRIPKVLGVKDGWFEHRDLPMISGTFHSRWNRINKKV